MTAVTVTDLNNAKVDVDHIAAIANSLSPTATDRLGNVKQTISGVLASLPDSGVIGKDTLTSLNADLMHTEGTVAYVTNDSTLSNNTIYRKVGSSGTGSWVKSSEDRVLLLEQKQGWIGKPWLALDAALPTTTNDLELRSAIQSVRITNGSMLRSYYISVFCKDSTLYNDRIIIRDDLGGTYQFDGTVAGKASGVVTVAFTASGVTFTFLIDYRKAASSNLVVTDASIGKFKLSANVFAMSDIAVASAANTASIALLNKPWRSSSASTATTTNLQAIDAIQVVNCYGGSKTKSYRITVLAKNDPTYADRIHITDNPVTTTWAFDGTVAGKDNGPVWVTLKNATTSFELLIDYRRIINNGLAVVGFNDNLKLSDAIFLDEKTRGVADQALTLASSSESSVLAKAIRVAIAGSSITWGQGWLGEDSYVGRVEDYLRNNLATTLMGSNLAVTGSHSTVSNKLFYKGSATLLESAETEASFTMVGDELSLCIARERGNVGAALVELYVDDTLYDSFSTYNSEPYSTTPVFTFTGDGTTLKFDLGKSFTFGHTLAVNGVAKVVQLNTQGYGASIPAGVDALVIRKTVIVSGKPEVHHFLWFSTAPSVGAAITGTYSYGESITYVKNTVGQTTRPLSGINESPFGDGNVSLDPASPSAISSGLGFRETDERSILSWHFGSSASRKFCVKIVALDPRSSGTPKMYLNFATNRMHHIQNAGIGGWTADFLLTDTGLNNLEAVLRFQPDIMFFESCTNDDWLTNVNRAYVTKTGLTDTAVRTDESSNFFNAVTFVGSNNYTVQDIRVPVVAITENSVDFSPTGIFNVVVGDVVILGDFKGDNRRVACRVVSAWDSVNKRISWNKPLRYSEIAHIKSLNDLVGTTAIVKGAPTWVSNVETIIDKVRVALPKTAIVLGTGGIPNIRYRRLEGYRELAQDIAARKDCHFVDFYRKTMNWQYSQPAITQKYLNASASVTSTGASSYKLYNENGTTPSTSGLLRNWSVKVNGIERINSGCFVTGGSKKGWPSDVTVMTSANAVLTGDDYYLIFSENIPTTGDTIVVKHSAVKWSEDDTHPAPAGFYSFGLASTAVLEEII